jgi:hypothetical protein
MFSPSAGSLNSITESIPLLVNLLFKSQCHYKPAPYLSIS